MFLSDASKIVNKSKTKTQADILLHHFRTLKRMCARVQSNITDSSCPIQFVIVLDVFRKTKDYRLKELGRYQRGFELKNKPRQRQLNKINTCISTRSEE